MKYIVFDLEFNQGFDQKNEKTVPDENCPFEIIQIGAIKLNSKLELIDTFNSYIKPNIYKNLHPFIKKMTQINKKTLKNAQSFEVVYKNFLDFIKDEKVIFCIWGGADMKEFFRNIDYYNLDYEAFPKQYINLQKYASKHFNNPSGKNIGLQNAIKLLNIEENKNFHDALNDAYYTAQVFRKIYNKKIPVENYNFEKVKSKPKKQKMVVDYNQLFLEFEKILNKKLSKEEKHIIELSYKMGKTNQFLVPKLNYNKK